MEYIILACISALSIVLIFFAFFVGLHYGSKIKNGEVINKPTLNPVKAIREKIEDSKEEAKTEKEKEIENIILSNIDNYNGSELGQIDIPR